MKTTPHHSGFTLIELMMVVAIVGILSTVAYPITVKTVLRTKSSERAYMLRAVKQAVEESYRQYGSFPPPSFGAPAVTSALNPPLPLSARKRPIDPALLGWSLVTPYLVVEGTVYYSYLFTATEGGSPTLALFAFGDLDADGTSTTKRFGYQRLQGSYLMPSDPATCSAALGFTPCEYPAAGQEDEVTFGSF